MKTIAKAALALALSVGALPCSAGLSLDSCLQLACDNYPLISRYALLDRITAIELSDIDRSWLPRVGLYAQGTVQNAVPEFPGALREVISQLGQDMRGLGKAQYKAGADISQNIWDGGQSKAQRNMTRASHAMQQAALDVQLYAVRERVQDLYFGILLVDEQISQTESTVKLLDANIDRLKAMLRNGSAMQADVDMLEAQLLQLRQQLAGARGGRGAYADMLSVFIGRQVSGEILEKPAAEIPDDLTPARPELRMYDARRRYNSSRLSALDAALMPRLSFFAQAYYGYPGFDYFGSMRSRDPKFNAMAGLKLSWSLSPLYTRRNDRERVALENATVDNDEEVFRFNTRLQSAGENRDIETMRGVIADDGRIVELRRNVRVAAESQLRNGIIDAMALLTKINDENQARLTAAYHQVKLLQLIYRLRNTLNR